MDRVFVTNGINRAPAERAAADYYATDPKATAALLSVETFAPVIWEPCAGEKHITHVLEAAGYSVINSDIYNRGGYDDLFILDFMEAEANPYGDIITNPPYSMAAEFVRHALEISPEGVKVAMLLKLTFLEGQKRRELFKDYPLKKLYVFSKRIGCAKNGNFETLKSSAVAYGWFIWEKGYNGPAVIEWL